MEIEGIELKDVHISEEVTYYEPNTGTADAGYISSWNDTYVFVEYKKCHSIQATKPEELYWKDREVEFRIKYEIIKKFEVEGLLDIDDFTIYVSGERNNDLSVAISFKNVIIENVKCSLNDDYCKIYDVNEMYEYKKKNLRRKIQIDKIL